MATSQPLFLPIKERIFCSTKSRSATVLPSLVGRPLNYLKLDFCKITRAVEAVHKGMSIRRAAEEYGIPQSTLHDHVVGKVKLGSKSGPRMYLNSTDELDLVNFLTGSSQLGYSRTTKQVIQIVQDVVDEKGLEATVSPSWWQSFKSRHKELTLRDPELTSHMRLNGASDANLENYFDLLELTLQESDLTEKPCLIFNIDESGFPLNPKPPKIVTKKGERHPICVTGCEKTQITVLACCSAAIPPLVIFDRKTLRPEMVIGEVPRTMYGLSASGWMDSEIFENWFLTHFLAYVPPSRPLLLLMDGHSSHFSPTFVNTAAEEKIVVFCLPPHSTHRTQPLIRVFLDQ